MNTQIAINPPVVFTPAQPILNQPVHQITVSELTLRGTQDDPTMKQVRANFFETPFPLILWDGDAYDAIGQYTDEQIQAQIATLLSSNTASVVESLFAPPAHIDPSVIRARFQARFGTNPAPRPAWVAPQSLNGHTGATGPAPVVSGVTGATGGATGATGATGAVA